MSISDALPSPEAYISTRHFGGIIRVLAVAVYHAFRLQDERISPMLIRATIGFYAAEIRSTVYL